MPLATNLYLGNLSHELTEFDLIPLFVRFGEIDSVKLMLPRNEEERRRKRNCAFIKFHTYPAAFLAK